MTSFVSTDVEPFEGKVRAGFRKQRTLTLKERRDKLAVIRLGRN